VMLALFRLTHHLALVRLTVRLTVHNCRLR
jgi:hypothetical protein